MVGIKFIIPIIKDTAASNTNPTLKKIFLRININAIQIRNINNEAINATSATVQSVATQYIVDNYQRQPKQLDGLIITLTDQNNDKVLFVYSETSSLWINVGLNGVDLSNYVSLDQEQTITGNKNFTGNLQKNGKDVASVDFVAAFLNELDDVVSGFSFNDFRSLFGVCKVESHRSVFLEEFGASFKSDFAAAGSRAVLRV